jgi:hypothetical protein
MALTCTDVRGPTSPRNGRRCDLVPGLRVGGLPRRRALKPLTPLPLEVPPVAAPCAAGGPHAHSRRFMFASRPRGTCEIGGSPRGGRGRARSTWVPSTAGNAAGLSGWSRGPAGVTVSADPPRRQRLIVLPGSSSEPSSGKDRAASSSASSSARISSTSSSATGVSSMLSLMAIPFASMTRGHRMQADRCSDTRTVWSDRPLGSSPGGGCGLRPHSQGPWVDVLRSSSTSSPGVRTAPFPKPDARHPVNARMRGPFTDLRSRVVGGLLGRPWYGLADYPTGISYTDDDMAALPLQRHNFHGDWNYTLLPSDTPQEPG